jgi:hypothetical protein
LQMDLRIYFYNKLEVFQSYFIKTIITILNKRHILKNITNFYSYITNY